MTLLLPLILGCIQEESLISKPNEDKLEITLQVDKALYQKGEPIRLNLIATNKTDDTIKLTFPSSQRYDFVVKSQGGEEVWRWSKDRMFAMMLYEEELKPKDCLVYKETWNQLNNQGKPVPLGRYEIIGVLKTHPVGLSRSVAIEIK